MFLNAMKKLLTSLVAVLFIFSAKAQEHRGLTTESFSKIEISGAFTVFFRQGPSYEAVAYAEDFEDLDWSVSNDEFSLEVDHALWNTINGDDFRIYITAPNLSSIELNGAIDFKGKNLFDGDKLSVTINGASSFSLDADVASFHLEANGGTDISLNGRSRYAEIELTGASDLEAFKFEVNRMDLELSGAASARINVIDELDVEASGACEITYKGEPVIHSDLTLASSLNQQ